MKNEIWSNQTALITGASSGIGAATARFLAKKGIHVILVARRLDRLNELEQEIADFGGSARIIQVDLSNESERLNLFETLNTAGQLPNILINNAGLAWYGYFNEMPWNIAADIISLNIEATTHLMQLFLPNMLEQKFGRIINIGSISGKLPEQGIAVYSGSKAYLDAISSSSYRDLRGTGVTVSVVRAGPVKTEFFDNARNLENGKSVPAERFAINSDRVANVAWKLIRSPRRFAYVPFYMALSPLLETFFSGIIDLVGPLLLRKRK